MERRLLARSSLGIEIYGAIALPSIPAGRTKFLTNKTKANIAARDGYNSSSTGTAETHYAYTVLQAVDQAPTTSPEYAFNPSNGRLLFDWGAFQPARVPFWDKQSGGASDKYPTLGEPEGLNETFVGDNTEPISITRQFPVGYYAIHTLFDYSHYDSYQEVKLTWQQATQNLIQNGDFSSGETNWSKTGSVTFPSNNANFSGACTLSQNITGLTSGIPYRLQFTIAQNGTVPLELDITSSWLDPPSPYQSTSFSSAASYVVDFKLPSGTSYLLKFTTGSGADLTIDDVKLAALMHGTFKLAFGGESTEDFIEAGLRVRAVDDVISTTTDLRYAIDAGLRGLSTIPQTPAGAPAVGAFFRSDSTESTAHPLEGAMTKLIDVFFFNPAKRGEIWPSGAGFDPGFGYFHPELSRESAISGTRGTLPDGTVNADLNGSVTVTPVFEFPSNSDAFLHNYIDFLDDRGEPIRDRNGERSVVALKNTNWAWWLRRFMEKWWSEFELLSVSPPATIDHLINDHEQNFDLDDVRLDRRYGDSRTIAGQGEQVQDFHAQPYFNTYWRPALGQTISEKVGLGTQWQYFNSDVNTATLDYQVWNDIFRGAGRLMESKMLYSAVYQACAAHFPNIAVGGWWAYTHSIGLIADAGIGSPIYQLGWLLGTHQGHSLYNAVGLLGAVGKHAINIPNVAEERTWIPQSTAKVKRIRRDTVVLFGQSRGEVTVEVFNATDTNADAPPENRTDIQLRKGNDQFLNGLQEGHLVEVVDILRLGALGALPQNAAAAAAFWANDIKNPFLADNRMTKFAVTKLGHVNDSGNFVPDEPDGDGNFTACKYIDVLHSGAISWLDCVVSIQNRGLTLDTITGWDTFLFNILQLRSMFLASQYPISCWHGAEDIGYFAAQQRQYRIEVYFHAWLHGETHRHFYNTAALDGDNDPFIDPDTREESELQTSKAMQEITLLCPFKDVKPLSGNYMKPSIQKTDFVVSGASIPNNKRLFRVTLKDTQLVEFTGSGYSRKYPKMISHIRSGTDYEDFRTISGRILRVPGRIKQPGGQPSNFTDFGWWLEASNPNP